MSSEEFISLCFFLIFFISILYGIYKAIMMIFGDHLLPITLFIKRRKLSKYDRYAIERLVERRIPYYKSLSTRGKLKFLNRLIDHYVNKTFKGRQGQIITREIKVIISAGVTQLTFGLNYYFLRHFSTYFVYPDAFRISKKHPEMYGATVKNGIILFSWNKLREGYEDYEDGINLAIHEFCHALVIQHKVGVLKDMDWGANYDNWFHSGYALLKKRENEDIKYFRRNVLDTPTEMFPILVEEFFERPSEFKENFPIIFNNTVRLLNQNPLMHEEDYIAKIKGLLAFK